jgi:transcriptional regulator with XRE-family HTH domain
VLPDRRRELGGYIRQQRSESRLSLRRLSQQAGISNPYLSQIERGLRKPSAEILQRIARALHISAESLYVRAGILDETSLDLVPCIRRDPRLTAEQKDQLERIYLGYLEMNDGTGELGDVSEAN